MVNQKKLLLISKASLILFLIIGLLPISFAQELTAEEQANVEASKFALSSSDSVKALNDADLHTHLSTALNPDNQVSNDDINRIMSHLTKGDVVRVANVDTNSEIMDKDVFSKKYGEECQKSPAILNTAGNEVSSKNYLATKNIEDKRGDFSKMDSHARIKEVRTDGAIVNDRGVIIGSSAQTDTGSGVIMGENGMAKIGGTGEVGATEVMKGEIGKTKDGGWSITGEEKNLAEVKVSKVTANTADTNIQLKNARVYKETEIPTSRKAFDFDKTGGVYSKTNGVEELSPAKGGKLSIKDTTSSGTYLGEPRYIDEKQILDTTGAVNIDKDKTTLREGDVTLYKSNGKSAGSITIGKTNEFTYAGTSVTKSSAAENLYLEPYVGVDEEGKITAQLNQKGLNVDIKTGGSGVRILGANPESTYTIQDGGKLTSVNGKLSGSFDYKKWDESVSIQKVDETGKVIANHEITHERGWIRDTVNYKIETGDGSKTITQFGEKVKTLSSETTTDTFLDVWGEDLELAEFEYERWAWSDSLFDGTPVEEDLSIPDTFYPEDLEAAQADLAKSKASSTSSELSTFIPEEVEAAEQELLKSTPTEDLSSIKTFETSDLEVVFDEKVVVDELKIRNNFKYLTTDDGQTYLEVTNDDGTTRTFAYHPVDKTWVMYDKENKWVPLDYSKLTDEEKGVLMFQTYGEASSAYSNLIPIPTKAENLNDIKGILPAVSGDASKAEKLAYVGPKGNQKRITSAVVQSNGDINYYSSDKTLSVKPLATYKASTGFTDPVSDGDTISVYDRGNPVITPAAPKIDQAILTAEATALQNNLERTSTRTDPSLAIQYADKLLQIYQQLGTLTDSTGVQTCSKAGQNYDKATKKCKNR